MAKFAISMSDAFLAEIEAARRGTGESRSEFLRRAVETMLREEREREWDEQYVRGYKEMPETVDDTLYSQELQALLHAELPWEPARSGQHAKR